MICNVCGEDARCYCLVETRFNPGLTLRGDGLLFNICSVCLEKLIKSIKTDKTKLNDPKKTITVDEIKERRNSFRKSVK